MAHSTLVFKNSIGERREAPVGFSWTSLFFGWIVPIFRKDWKFFGIWLGLYILSAILTGGLASIVVGIVQSLVYNKWYIQDLMKNGYKLTAMQSIKSLEMLSVELGVELKLEETPKQ